MIGIEDEEFPRRRVGAVVAIIAGVVPVFTRTLDSFSSMETPRMSALHSMLRYFAAVVVVFIGGCQTSSPHPDPVPNPNDRDPCVVNELNSLTFSDQSKKDQGLKLAAQIPGYGGNIEFKNIAEQALLDVRNYTTDSVLRKAAIMSNLANCLKNRADEFRRGDTYKRWTDQKKEEFDVRSYEQVEIYLKKVAEIIQPPREPDPATKTVPAPVTKSVPALPAPFPEAEIRMLAFEKDNRQGPRANFYKIDRQGAFSGNFEHLNTVHWNDRIRSLALYGPPGTTIKLYDRDTFQVDDDAVQIRIPAGSSVVFVDHLDGDPVKGVTWIADPGNDKRGLSGKVSSIRWDP